MRGPDRSRGKGKTRMRITLTEEVKLLAAVDCLKPLSREELEEFAKGHPDAYFQPGKLLSTPWEEDERLLILKKGRIQIYRIWQGRKQVLSQVEHGTALATHRLHGSSQVEHGTALATHRLHGSYVEAMEPVIVLSLAKGAALRLIERHPEVAWWLIEGLTKRMRRCDEKLADLALKKTPTRLANLVLQLVEDEGVATPEGYRIPTRYTHDELGTMIGARRVAVTRALGELKGEEVVKVKGRLLYVTDLEALKCLAEAG